MLRKKQSNWSDEQMKTIFDMRKGGATVDDISKVFPKRTIDAIKAKLNRMGFSHVDA
jgi:uncharacterized protein (DUF433 family)